MVPFQATDAPSFDWQATGKAYFEAGGIDPSATGLDVLLENEAFCHVSLGSFELYIPLEQLKSATTAELFQKFALITVDIQSTWHGWRETDLDSDRPDKDWKALRKWVKGWNPKKMAHLEGGATPINTQIKGGEKIQELQDRIAAHTQTNPKWEEYLGTRNKVVFAPRRQDFLEVLAASGLLEEEQQEFVWDDANLTRTAAWIDWVEVLCFEESAYPFDISQPYLGQTMNRVEPTARTQFVADRVTLQLMRKEFYPNGTHFFELSLGTNLVIQALGYNNARAGDWNVSYKTAGGQTQPYERFIPGGNAGGGLLPARRATSGETTGSQTEVSRYRDEKGANFFQASLKLSQKEGAKLAKEDKAGPLAKNKLAHFVLHSYENNTDTYISAPFLGPLADAKKLPDDEYIDDYEDFFRAYRSGFFHWIIAEAGKDEELARDQFALLIKNQSTREVETSFLSVIEDVYDLALSSADDSEDSLEWRYLAWIKKSK